MATIKEVAERAQVSTATVSYVLNGTGSVTEPTRRRVLAAVAELNYQPNYAARSLRTRSRTLGLVLPALAARLSDPALVETLAGLSEAAAGRGYYLLLATAGEAQPEAELGEQLVRSGRVDGLIMLDLHTNDERIQYLHERHIPIVCAGPPPEGASCPAAGIDVYGGARRAVQHLLSLGHRRIGLIALPSDLVVSEPIYEGYVAALAAAGIESDPALIIEVSSSEDHGMTATQELLGLPEPPGALLAASGALALGAMHAIREAGMVVGHDCSLVGFDDGPPAAHSDPPLTALRVPSRALGRQLAGLLIDLIEQKPLPQQAHLLDMQLIIRRSTGSWKQE